MAIPSIKKPEADKPAFSERDRHPITLNGETYFVTVGDRGPGSVTTFAVRTATKKGEPGGIIGSYGHAAEYWNLMFNAAFGKLALAAMEKMHQRQYGNGNGNGTYGGR